MESSYKIIKNSHVNLKERRNKVIDTSVDISRKFYKDDPETNHRNTNDNSMEDDLRSEIELEIEEERQFILEKAKAEAIVLKEEAEKMAKAKGYEEGHRKGYDAGFAQGVNESLSIKRNALDIVSQSEEYVEEYFEENKENLIELAATMAENIVHRTIDTSDENIMMILEPILREYVHKENIIITCHPNNFYNLKDSLSELEELAGGNKIIILKDGNLEKNGCTLENTKQFMDLQIKTQIENILKDVESMEREN